MYKLTNRKFEDENKFYLDTVANYCCHCNKRMYSWIDHFSDPWWIGNILTQSQYESTAILLIWKLDNTFIPICGSCVDWVYLYV